MKKLKFSAEERTKLKHLGVDAVILFGSRAIGMAREKSDFDIGILVRDPKIIFSPEKKSTLYDQLYDILSENIRQLVNIDIVFLQNVSAELQAHVMKHGKILYESDPNAFPNFKEQVMLQYADFAPLRTIFQSGTLSHIQ
ncbi:MAG: hypothetical protein A3F54_03965 [Candidatus Kerfeldbacteria bacterium RIFCSPHIGHO2_12_FULL_48_17]|uniref:Polymerase beta nucleotidyltransferase domain-containing protein n=1 Tax=Candidatus Kerfeldbacteria bacterium RIFCSPHIGHO2_12_FULL_48_17 TaxID=1798542 RepID=A0A1G2B7W5_9BACT|nr:MAG: hypothetical protein A3F54_03965 [Candidatus Kerfeldbacteria bacterium RIFCSPHIGHO2_12_FULL_48_17]